MPALRVRGPRGDAGVLVPWERGWGGGGWLCPQAVLRGARLFPKQQLHFHELSQNPGIPDPECPQMMFDPGGLSFRAVEGENGMGGGFVC